MKWLLSFVSAVLFSLMLSNGSLAREEIRSFIADIQVRTDASLEVTETITVNAEGRDIRRGIYRDIPLRALDDWGLWSSNGFELIEVLHNGQPAPHNTEWQGRFFRIKIGDADTFIQRGEHTYTIRYVTTRQLRFFDGYDELYWNVTGTFWSFPILAAEARVALPDGARAEQLSAYTGGFGSTGSDYSTSGEGTSTPTFVLTRPLDVFAGMTIAVGFTKGVVTPDSDSAFTMLGDNAGIFLLILCWLGVPVYFFYVWNKVGRDPPSPPIIPLFHPPEDLSPAALSYAHFNGFRSGPGGSDVAFIAALLSLGVKRILTISEDRDGDITLERGVAADKHDELPKGEAALFRNTIGDSDRFPMTSANGIRLATARNALRDAIYGEYGERYYSSNIGRLVFGVLFAAVTLVIGLGLQGPPEDAFTHLLPVILACSLGGGAIVASRFLQNGPGAGTARRLLAAMLALLGGGLFLIGLLFVFSAGELPVYQAVGLLLVIGIAVIVSMIFLLGAPTKTGAKVLADIKGFKLYLETAETNRLNMRDAPEMSEELFERFLPYAAGLGVEKPWSEAWAAQLARVAPDRKNDYQPQWYHGNSWSPGNIGAAAASSVAAVSAAMAASMPQPKSSSGSSGGGSSGGGGGGGGGGGW